MAADNTSQDRVGQGVAHPGSHCDEEDGKAGQPVYRGVTPISDKGGAADLFANLHPKQGTPSPPATPTTADMLTTQM